ncbi:MAG TPA: hypothetical protein PK431_01535 [Chitinophagales bacterium]|nr:hypothetical protein [Chitinophagales bacterium]
MRKYLTKLWHAIGMKLFGDFFTKLHAYKQMRLKQSRIMKAARYRMHKQGLKVFEVNGKKVIARNKKNAERKAAQTK